MTLLAEKRPVGRPRKDGDRVRSYSVSLPESLGDWCQSQPEQFSQLVRSLLEQERNRRAKSQRAKRREP